MKNPRSHDGTGARMKIGNIQIGKSEDTKKRPARSSVSNVVTFPGARYEQPAESHEAWLAVVAAITARDAHIAAGGAIGDPEYKRLASVAVMACESYERDYLAKGAA